MCKLACIVDTGRHDMRVANALMHELLLRSNASRQYDGYGVGTIDDGVFRTTTEYHLMPPTWMANVRLGACALLGHTRQASTGTAKTMMENHPYFFANGERPFMGAHNGYLFGTIGYKGEGPNTDSWRALARLADIADGAALTESMLRGWIEEYDDASSFAFIIVQRVDGKDNVWALRNGQRNLSTVKINGSNIIFTDKGVLNAAVLSLQAQGLLTENDIGPIVELEPNRVHLFDDQGWGAYETEFKLHRIPVTTYVPAAWNDTKPTGNGSNGGNSNGSNGNAISVASNAGLERWRSLRMLMTPLREQLVWYYAAHVLQHKNCFGDYEINPMTLSADDLAFVQNQATKVTPAQAHVLHAWNAKVAPIYDIDEQIVHFGAIPFWLQDLHEVQKVINAMERRK